MTVKLEKELLEDIDNECEGLGCNRTDFVIEAVQEKLEGKNEEPKEEPKPKEVQNARIEPKTHTIEVDFDPKDYEIEKAEPKATVELIPKEIIKEVPQDNSNKPPAHFAQFNGKLLPFAKRYNI